MITPTVITQSTINSTIGIGFKDIKLPARAVQIFCYYCAGVWEAAGELFAHA